MVSIKEVIMDYEYRVAYLIRFGNDYGFEPYEYEEDPEPYEYPYGYDEEGDLNFGLHDYNVPIDYMP
jgi:hypothetical protein